MHIVIAGGTGYIGQALTKHYLAKRYIVSIIGRSINKIKKIYGNKVQAFNWDHLADIDLNLFSRVDLVINLAGEPIADYTWSTKRRRILFESRIETTEKIVVALKALGSDAPPLFNASAVGVYSVFKADAETKFEPFTEAYDALNTKTSDFSSFLAKPWEEITHLAKDNGVRVVNMRFGVVLGKKCPLFRKILLPFKLGLGGRLGNGYQPFAWIHIDDLVRIVDFLFQHKEISGPVNFVAPSLNNNRDFTKALAKALHRPAFLHMPAFLLKFHFGKLADELMLSGQAVKPKVLLDADYQFKFSDLSEALVAAV